MRPRSKRCHDSAGFTIVELMIVSVIGVILTGIVVLNFPRALDSARLNSAVTLTSNQLRMAHEEAMDKRLQYVVTFTAPGTITTQWSKTGIALQTERVVTLPTGIQFSAEPGIAAIAPPDGFGNGVTAIDFDQATGGGSNVIFFQPDGTAIDGAGNPNNGVIYIAKPGQLYSSRAITLFGATGRLKTWYLATKGANPQWR